MFKTVLFAVLLSFAPIVCAQATKNGQSNKQPVGVQDAAGSQSVTKSIQAKPSTVSIERYEGGSIQTHLGYNITLNKESSLKREWFVVRDEIAPLSIEGSTGVRVEYKAGERYSSGQYQYTADFQVNPKEEIKAFEVRVLVLDIFGKVVKTLSSTKISDFTNTTSFQAVWRIWSENEASEAFASVAYIAQVRTASGRVYEADTSAVFDQVRKVARRLTEADLEPKRENPQAQK